MITFINLLILFIIFTLFLIPATNKKRLNNISLLASLFQIFSKLPFLFPSFIFLATLSIQLFFEFSYLVEISFLLIANFIIYYVFYFQNNLKKSLISFISFLINFLTLITLIFSFMNLLIFWRTQMPTMLFDELSVFSKYKYLFLISAFVIYFFYIFLTRMFLMLLQYPLYYIRKL